jgi:hypothetical protein
MARHPIDRPRATDDGLKAEHYAAIERRGRDEATHPKVDRLARRPRAGDPARRTQEFVRIARGETA